MKECCYNCIYCDKKKVYASIFGDMLAYRCKKKTSDCGVFRPKIKFNEEWNMQRTSDACPLYEENLQYSMFSKKGISL